VARNAQTRRLTDRLSEAAGGSSLIASAGLGGQDIDQAAAELVDPGPLEYDVYMPSRSASVAPSWAAPLNLEGRPMRSKPSNWYQMTYDEQRAWERQERERDDLEYDLERAREDAEHAARRAKRKLAAQREELESMRDVASGSSAAASEARHALHQAHAFIRAKGLWDEYLACFPPAADDDDDALDLNDDPADQA
jgi:hypothetical protein